jgi:hypothetical protein
MGETDIEKYMPSFHLYLFTVLTLIMVQVLWMLMHLHYCKNLIPSSYMQQPLDII